MFSAKARIVVGLLAYSALSGVAFADQPPPGGTPPGQPDNISILDPMSKIERQRLLQREQETFALQVDGKYYKALKEYCDSGFGDQRCTGQTTMKPQTAATFAPAPVTPLPLPKTGSVPPPPNGAAPSPAPTPAVRELPTVDQITGFGNDLSAILSLSSGQKLRVIGPDHSGPRSQLPTGEQVISIKPGEVTVQRPGEAHGTPLLFLGGAGATGPAHLPIELNHN